MAMHAEVRGWMRGVAEAKAQCYDMEHSHSLGNGNVYFKGCGHGVVCREYDRRIVCDVEY